MVPSWHHDGILVLGSLVSGGISDLNWLHGGIVVLFWHHGGFVVLMLST